MPRKKPKVSRPPGVSDRLAEQSATAGGRREYDREPWDALAGLARGNGRERPSWTWVTMTYDDGTTASGRVLANELRDGVDSDYGIARWLPARRGVRYIPVDIETGEPLP